MSVLPGFVLGLGVGLVGGGVDERLLAVLGVVVFGREVTVASSVRPGGAVMASGSSTARFEFASASDVIFAFASAPGSTATSAFAGAIIDSSTVASGDGVGSTTAPAA